MKLAKLLALVAISTLTTAGSVLADDVNVDCNGDANGNGRTQFPGNVIPANRINPVAKAIAAYKP